MSKIMIAATLAMLSTLSGPEGRVSSECPAGLQEALIAGRFSGGPVCSGEESTFILSGTTRSGYTVYDYRYRVMAAAVMHGGQRILIFKDSDYVGQYSLSPPPYSTLSVTDSRVVVETPGSPSEEAVLVFSNGPPLQVFIDGHVLDLYR